ncbi:hypothetical protein [Tritonibacter mobilis]|uniref:hypothetical protein n=1 Tax=Tritonibacter mobilis TaxID=379347 RepID=UPI000806ACA6|nr:hypothetical protein [Tritonibacter mobilis]
MAQIKKIVRSNPVSNFRQVAPDGGATFRVIAQGLNTLYDRVAPVAKEKLTQEGLEWGRQQGRNMVGGMDLPATAGPTEVSAEWAPIRAGIFAGESGGDYDALFGYSNREGGKFSGVKLTNMTVDQALQFSNPSGEYGQWVKGKVGRVATPMGAYQVVGTTLRAAKKALGLTGNERMSEDLQEKIGQWIYRKQGTGAWEGYKGPRDPGRYPVRDQSVLVREPSGAMTTRKYSPYAGPILQAHDQAARVALQAEMLNQASVDLQDIANRYELDADGYTQAAESYIDQIIEQAPEEIRGDLGQTLSTEAHRTRLGIKDAQHRDTRARANNSSRALVDRWSGEYSEALASGDPEEIAAARNKLDNILQAREALPGVAWTPEQSANIFLDAEDAAQKILTTRSKELSSQYKDTFDLITDAAKAGRQAEGEELLQNPAAVAMHPEKAREAAAFVALRDNTPGFMKMTPDQQAQEVANLKAGEVSEEWQIDVANAATKMAKENRKAWQDDPVKRAGEVLDTPPPTLPDLTADDPSKFVEALAARREYMNGLRAAGYTDTKAFLSEKEAEELGVLMSKGTDPAIRSAMSGAIVQGFGADAVRVFDEIGGDRVTMFAGKMQALGGRPEVAAAILRGQQMISENMVQLPPKSDRISAFDGQVAVAFQGIPGALDAQAEVMEAAKALYASEAQGIDPTSEAATDLMKQSVQTVLGQAKNKRGELTGGVQEIMGHQTLLPVGVPGNRVDVVLRGALGASPERVRDIPGRIAQGLTNIGQEILGNGPAAGGSDLWGSIGVDGVPSINGQPIPARYVNNDMVRPVSIGGNMYRLELTNGTSKWDVEDGNGDVLVFDLSKLMEASE